MYRVKQRFTEEGLAGVLKDRPQANRHRKLDDRGEAHLIALACSPPPAGHDHWTLRLLAGKVVELKLASSMSHEGVRKRLKKNALKPWQKREWCIPKVSAEFVANMEDLLDLYAEPYDPRRPVVCFDETSTQLLAETRPSLPPRPGRNSGLPTVTENAFGGRTREGVVMDATCCTRLAGLVSRGGQRGAHVADEETLDQALVSGAHDGRPTSPPIQIAS